MVKATKSATTELNNAIKTEITRQGKGTGKQGAKGRGRGKAGIGGDATLSPAPVVGAALFDTVPHKHGCKMASCCLEDGSTVADLKSFVEPAIIRCASLKDKLVGIPNFKEILDTFVKDFDQTALRQTRGRGGSRIESSDVTQTVNDVLVGMVPRFQNTSADTATSQAMMPTLFIIVKDALVSSNEPDNVASLRFQATGTRSVIAAPVEDLKAFMAMEASGLTGGEKKYTPSATARYLKNMSPEQIKLFTEKFNLYAGTIAAGEFFYLPAAFSMVEKVSIGEDITGIAIRGMIAKDTRSIEVLNLLISESSPDSSSTGIMKESVKLSLP